MVTRPTLALVGEAGPEAIIPLSKMRGGGGGVVVNLAVEVNQGDGEVTQARVAGLVAKAVRESPALARHFRNAGRGLGG